MQRRERKLSGYGDGDGKELSDTLDNCVISVGGGLVLREVNRELLRKLGTVVYLKASEEELCKG